MSDEKASTLPDFNQSRSDKVAAIESITETLLQFLRDGVPASRERSIAITNYEQAAMWAVKAARHAPRNGDTA